MNAIDAAGYRERNDRSAIHKVEEGKREPSPVSEAKYRSFAAVRRDVRELETHPTEKKTVKETSNTACEILIDYPATSTARRREIDYRLGLMYAIRDDFG